MFTLGFSEVSGGQWGQGGQGGQATKSVCFINVFFFFVCV